MDTVENLRKETLRRWSEELEATFFKNFMSAMVEHGHEPLGVVGEWVIAEGFFYHEKCSDLDVLKGKKFGDVFIPDSCVYCKEKVPDNIKITGDLLKL